MKKKKHKIKVVKLKFSEPTIKAIRIPKNCSLADADKIESIFKNVKRFAWDASKDAVYRFSVRAVEPNALPQSALTGMWIIRLYDPMTDKVQFVVLNKSEYKRAFRKK